jgi:uroporphyrinogen III methyltransferase/synthase
MNIDCKNNKGKVYLIGAGPGDPGLITLKGRECLSKADIIVYDYLVNTKLLDHKKENAQITYVGKKRGHKELSQSKINKLLIEYAKSGKVIARLKGGDPFIFGRGAEEAIELRKNDIPFEVIPGISSFYAVPEYAGIPPTHRDVSSTLTVITGHEDPAKSRSNIPWASLAKISTIIFLMGIKNLSEIVKKLKKNGKKPDTPAAIITWGTYPGQKTVTGTLNDIIGKSEQNQISPPGILIIGEVVKYRQQIKWFENRPLYGKKILVTRPADSSKGFIDKLNELGAQTVEFPTIEICPPSSWKTFDKSLKKLGNTDWIIFTSANGVKYFFERFFEKKLNVKSLFNINFAVIGEKTNESLNKFGLSADLIPKEYRAEGLIEEFKSIDLIGKNVLIPRAKEARDILPKKLKRLGANVEVVGVYENKKPDKLNSRKLKSEIRDSDLDIITFTSPSTVINFYSVFRADEKSFKDCIIASIGPITNKALNEHGKKADITPKKYTTDSLIEEILNYYRNQ